MIIGMSGYAGSGKDTVADILVADHGYERRSFAALLKQAVYNLDPVLTSAGLRVQHLVDKYGWDVVKREYPEARRLLQRFGTEVGRTLFGENFWVDQAFVGIGADDKIVFTDCRFVNEALAVQVCGGDVWRIERPGVNALNAHPSETSLDDFDFDAIIANDGTIRDLASAVKFLLGRVAA